MFDIGWSEILVIAAVAIIVVGPKELPRMLRSFGKTMGMVRRTANDFKRQFDEALREAEREAGLEDTRKELQSMARIDPLKDAKKEIDDTVRAAKAPIGPKPAKAASPQAAAKPHEAEPLKTGAAASAQGSDAA
ncbi:MAG TPA: Sec-independent protein translocase protein TatB [Propylenella sp.]